MTKIIKFLTRILTKTYEYQYNTIVKQIDNKLLKIRKAFKNYLHVKGYELEAH